MTRNAFLILTVLVVAMVNSPSIANAQASPEYRIREDRIKVDYNNPEHQIFKGVGLLMGPENCLGDDGEPSGGCNGTATVFMDRSHIITAAHILAHNGKLRGNAEDYQFSLFIDGEIEPYRVKKAALGSLSPAVQYEKHLDIAILEIEEVPEEIEPVYLTNSDKQSVTRLNRKELTGAGFPGDRHYSSPYTWKKNVRFGRPRGYFQKSIVGHKMKTAGRASGTLFVMRGDTRIEAVAMHLAYLEVGDQGLAVDLVHPDSRQLIRELLGKL